MPRKWLSIRQADLDRQLASLDASRVSDVDARAMILDHERHQRKNSTAAILVRLRTAFAVKREQVARSRAMREHDRPGHEHPSLAQWETFLASDDFIAFICRSLRLPLTDRSADIATARWRLRLARKDTNGIALASLVRDCLPAAIDEWQQDQRHGGPAETQEAIDLLAEIERELVAVDGAAVDSLAG